MSAFTTYQSGALLNTFATIGLLFLASKVYSYVKLLLDLFVLSGTNASIPIPKTLYALTYTLISLERTDPRGHGQS